LKHIINLVVGDWSHDGHGKSSIVTIRSSLTKSEIDNAYFEGSNKVGFSLIEDVGSEDAAILDREQLDKMEEAGIDTSYIGYYGSEGCCINDEDTFVDTYLAIVGLGDDTFEWERVGHEENHIRIGGYGIFC